MNKIREAIALIIFLITAIICGIPLTIILGIAAILSFIVCGLGFIAIVTAVAIIPTDVKNAIKEELKKN